MGPPSGEPALEALRVGKTAEEGGTVRGLARMRKTGYCAELFEDASLVGDYGSAVPPCCAESLTIACGIGPLG